MNDGEASLVHEGPLRQRPRRRHGQHHLGPRSRAQRRRPEHPSRQGVPRVRHRRFGAPRVPRAPEGDGHPPAQLSPRARGRRQGAVPSLRRRRVRRARRRRVRRARAMPPQQGAPRSHARRHLLRGRAHEPVEQPDARDAPALLQALRAVVHARARHRQAHDSQPSVGVERRRRARNVVGGVRDERRFRLGRFVFGVRRRRRRRRAGRRLGAGGSRPKRRRAWRHAHVRPRVQTPSSSSSYSSSSSSSSSFYSSSARKRRSALYAALLAFRLLACLAPGYVHPDEYHQSVEVAAADVLGLEVDHPWEFTAKNPARSALAPHSCAGWTYGAWRLIRYFWRYGGQSLEKGFEFFDAEDVVPAVVFLAPRLGMFSCR